MPSLRDAKTLRLGETQFRVSQFRDRARQFTRPNQSKDRIKMDRRNFCWQSALASVAVWGGRDLAGVCRANPNFNAEFPPIRAITKGPKFHWRGYYDKELFDPTNRFVLANEIDFEGRTPEPSDVLKVGMVDLQNDDKWIEIGSSFAWNWQQGCMLQWIPGNEQRILWNDREGSRFVCRILDLASRSIRTIPMPIYCIAPDGRWGLSVDFRRLNDCRPGYGYAGISDPYSQSRAPEETGIWRVDLQTGESKLLLSYAQIASIPYDSVKDVKFQFDPAISKHWFNHLLVAPGGERFLFLHRWRETPLGATREKISKTGFSTRMVTANADGTQVYVVDPYGKTSHFVWRDAKSICAWAWHPLHKEKFYLYEDQTRNVQGVGIDVMVANGHNTYLPGTNNDWILNDTYPDKGREQHPYLYQISTNTRVPLGSLLSPEKYQGEFRCDNHPSASRDGKSVVVDSPHGGNGRQVYLIDVSGIVK